MNGILKTEQDIENEYVLRLIKGNLAEVIGLDEIEQKLQKSPSDKLRIYWGTAPTRMPSIAYLVPLLKLRDCLLSKRVDVTILLADLHSYLDKGFSEVNKVEHRTNFYEFILSAMLESIGVEKKEVTFVRGSQMQLTPQYMKNLLQFTTLVNVNTAKHAGKEVVKKASSETESPLLSTLLYPLMQCLDEVGLHADIQLGGLDQRKIFMLSRDYMPKLNVTQSKCAYLMNPIIPSLRKGEKMSSSDPNGKLEFTDDLTQIENKLKRTACTDKDTNLATNPCLAILKYIVLQIEYSITTSAGECKDYQQFESLWLNGQISGEELKKIVAKYVDGIIQPVRTALQSEEGRRLYKLAYE